MNLKNQIIRLLLPNPKNLDNVSYNEKLWDFYKNAWFIRKLVVERSKSLQVIGDEWGNKEAVLEVISDFIKPYINSNSIVCEIGSGGGRIASKVAPLVKELHCFDISINMLNECKKNLNNTKNIYFNLLDKKTLLENIKTKFDFVYSFDVFVHMDLHAIFKYFRQIRQILNTNGKVFLHTSNLKTVNGWEKFNSQEYYSPEDFYFISPEIIEILANKAGFKIIKTSSEANSNPYFSRDYLFVME